MVSRPFAGSHTTHGPYCVPRLKIKTNKGIRDIHEGPRQELKKSGAAERIRIERASNDVGGRRLVPGLIAILSGASQG
jgi:hypothetical protein